MHDLVIRFFGTQGRGLLCSIDACGEIYFATLVLCQLRMVVCLIHETTFTQWIKVRVIEAGFFRRCDDFFRVIFY